MTIKELKNYLKSLEDAKDNWLVEISVDTGDKFKTRAQIQISGVQLTEKFNGLKPTNQGTLSLISKMAEGSRPAALPISSAVN